MRSFRKIKALGIGLWLLAVRFWRSGIIERSGVVTLPLMLVLFMVAICFGGSVERTNVTEYPESTVLEYEFVRIEPEKPPETTVPITPIPEDTTIAEPLATTPEPTTIKTNDIENGIWHSSDGVYAFHFNTLENSRQTGLFNGIPFTVDVLDTVYAEWSQGKYKIKPDFINLLAIFVKETGGNSLLYGRDVNGYLSAGLIQANNYDNKLWYTNNNTEITGLKPVAVYRERAVSYPTESQIESALLYYSSGLDPFNVQQITEYYLTRYQAIGEHYGWSEPRLLAANQMGVAGARGASQERIRQHHQHLLTIRAERLDVWQLN